MKNFSAKLFCTGLLSMVVAVILSTAYTSLFHQQASWGLRCLCIALSAAAIALMVAAILVEMWSEA